MQKQIAEAERRAQLILDAKRRNEEMLIERLRIKNEREQKLMESRLQTQQLKEFEKQRREQSIVQLSLGKIRDHDDVMQQKMRLRELRTELEVEKVGKVRQNTQALREKKQRTKEEKEMLQYLKSPPQNIVKVISQLELEREQRLKQALKFEEMELQLVQKLKQT